MRDITEATGLTKGAIYGNFASKEALSLAAFNFNIRYFMGKLSVILTEIDSPLNRLYALTNFYRTDYYKYSIEYGGCPLLNVGVDANHTNCKLFGRVTEVVIKLKNAISDMIIEGIECGEISLNVDAKVFGGRIFSLIEGATFTAVLLKDETYLIDMMDHVDKMIQNELE
jgi:AcrR family transcriptional regulator